MSYMMNDPILCAYRIALHIELSVCVFEAVSVVFSLLCYEREIRQINEITVSAH